MSKVRDRFETALKLSAKTEGITLPDAREEMRPLTKSQISERDWLRTQAQQRTGDDCAEHAIMLAIDRFLRRGTKVEPTEFDLAIIGEMDDHAISVFAWRDEEVELLKQLRVAAWERQRRPA